MERRPVYIADREQEKSLLANVEESDKFYAAVNRCTTPGAD